MNDVLELRRGYAAITQANMRIDAFDAYCEFHQLLEESRPDVEVVLATAIGDTAVLAAINQVRSGRVASTQKPYFRGSGIIMVGHSDGRILDGSYEAEGDRVAEQYPGYQYVALRKLGLAAVVGKLGFARRSDTDQYNQVQYILESRGLNASDWPHHLGYAIEETRSSLSDFFVAGASGMLASAQTKLATRLHYKDAILLGRDAGWLEWEGDEAAGLHDVVAAQSVLKHLANPKHFASATYSRDIANLSGRYLDGPNIH